MDRKEEVRRYGKEVVEESRDFPRGKNSARRWASSPGSLFRVSSGGPVPRGVFRGVMSDE
jgi:hypothetical protein